MAKKILVVDDDLTDLTLIEARLCREGYEVVKSANGAVGLIAAKNVLPDLVILDVEMPGMDGYTFLGEIRKIDLLKDVPVIILTSHDEHERIFQRRGIKAYLSKPVNFDELIPRIVQLIGEGSPKV